MNVRRRMIALMLIGCAVTAVAAEQRSVAFGSEPGPWEQKAIRLPWPKNPPRRIKRVAPVFHPDLHGQGGTVTLQVTLDGEGRVVELRAVAVMTPDRGTPTHDKPIADKLANAAMAAVREWQYEPVGDTPVTFMMSVAVRPAPDAQGDPSPREVKIRADNPALKNTREVKPRYPSVALHRGVQGVVILEATIGPHGRVLDARVLRWIPYLDQALLDAVLQWEFDPQALAAGGAPRIVLVEVVWNFSQ